LVKLKYFTC